MVLGVGSVFDERGTPVMLKAHTVLYRPVPTQCEALGPGRARLGMTLEPLALAGRGPHNQSLRYHQRHGLQGYLAHKKPCPPWILQ